MAKLTATELWIGEDHQFKFTVLDDEEVVAIDITTWSLSWMVKRRRSHADSLALLLKVTTGGAPGIVIGGTFNAAPETNTQVATVSVDDIDTDGSGLVAAIQPVLAYYELKRMTPGGEAPLAYGPLVFRQGVHRT